MRLIARLDIKGPNLVKGINLEGLRVLGKPENFAQYYYENGADEIMYMDVVASLFERNSLHEIITRTAKNSFIPLTVGGGIRTLEDIKAVLRAGADKVSINTAAIKNPEFIRKASRMFGASTIVVAIEAIKQDNGSYLAFIDNGREYTGIDVFKWAKEAESVGAGEILITCVDKEGTGLGFDIDLVNKISSIASIPVIAHGGAGTKEHIAEVISKGKADAISIASILHYDIIKNSKVNLNNESEGNVEFLKSGKSFSKIKPASIAEIKEYLESVHISCRGIIKSHEFING